ncbi:MAG: hypothetical protein M1825_000510 [Sarcosagium campestre]|nr:MAG: hypothetical protein M1825_000510 [Sarcosagium campestre]
MGPNRNITLGADAAGLQVVQGPNAEISNVESSGLEAVPLAHSDPHASTLEVVPGQINMNTPEPPLYDLAARSSDGSGYREDGKNSGRYDSEHGDLNTTSPERRSIKRRTAWIAGLVILILVVIIAGVVGGVMGSRKSKSKSRTYPLPETGRDSTPPIMFGDAVQQVETDYQYPSTLSYGFPNLDILAIGNDDSLKHKFRQPTNPRVFGPTVSGFQSLNGTASSKHKAVAATWRDKGHLDSFITGADGALYHKYHQDNTWIPSPDFENRGGNLTSSPAAITWGPNRLDIFALSQENSLVQQTFDGANGWLPWVDLGGNWTSYTPTAVTWAIGRLDVFVVNPINNALYHRYAEKDGEWTSPGGYTSEKLNSFERLGGILTSRPAAVSWGTGRLDVFARGGDGGLWTTNYTLTTDEWSDWAMLGSDIIGEPDAVSWGPERIDVFAWGADFSILHKKYHNGTWTPAEGFESLGGDFSGPPKATSDGEGNLHVVAFSKRGELMHRSWNETRNVWIPEDDFRNLGAP